MALKTIHIDTDNSALKRDLHSFIDKDNQIIANSNNLDNILNIITEYIINNVDELKLKKFIAKRFDEENIEDVKLYANKKIYDQINRKVRLKSLLLDYLTDRNKLYVEGFIRFRLRDYYNLLEKVINEITQDYIINKEYDKFILLIKKLIQTQSPLIDNLSIVVTFDNKYSLFDDYMIDITSLCINEFLEEFSYKEINTDDFLFSTILSLAPKVITIHNFKRFNNKDLLNTIKKIYESKLILCSGCEICRKNGG